MKLDMKHLFNRVFDEISKALRVKLTDTEISIELDHKDGDSVTSHPAKLVAKVSGVEESDSNTDIIPPLDCSSLTEVKLYLEGSLSAKIMVSPEDSGDLFFDHSEEKVIARRLKVVALSGKGSAHIVGRS